MLFISFLTVPGTTSVTVNVCLLTCYFFPHNHHYLWGDFTFGFSAVTVQIWHTVLFPPQLHHSPPLLPSWWNTPHPSSFWLCVCFLFITAKGRMGLLCKKRDSALHLMGLFTIGKNSFKKEKAEAAIAEPWLWSLSFLISLAHSAPFPGHVPGSPPLESSPWVLLQFPNDATSARLHAVTHFRNTGAPVY